VPTTSTASFAVRSPPIFLSDNPRGLNCPSTSRPPGSLASRFRNRCSCKPTAWFD